MRNVVMLIGRILLSAIFIQAGYSELAGFSGTAGYFEALGLPFPTLTAGLVIALEIIGGLALLVGYKTRIAAGLLGVFAIAAASIGHSDWNDIMHFQAFMKDLAISGGLFYVAVNGAGPLSVDARLE
jgi:putative oxidoreductase